MKFAQEFRRTLHSEGFPQKWVDSAIPYGQLKKCLKKVTRELVDLGLDRDTLASLAVTAHASSVASDEDPQTDLGFRYRLAGDDFGSTRVRPKLTIFVHLHNGEVVDAGLTPSTREFLGHLASGRLSSSLQRSSTSESRSTTPSQNSDQATQTAEPSKPPEVKGIDSADISVDHDAAPSTRRIEVPLVFDGEFFDLLQSDVVLLDSIQEEEQDRLGKEITALGTEVAKLTEPRRGLRDRPDRAKWRDIFQLYLDAGVFFSTRESDHGVRTSAQALEKLRWFQEQVFKQDLVRTMKLEVSRQAFSKFLNLNAALLQNLKFQELNSLAVTKILKKFDKRTSLGATKSFQVALHSHRLLAGNVAKDLCARMSTELISTVPQLDDYLCPICYSVAYWPMRLDCNHIFCSRCLVKMSRRCERFCPLCRADVVMKTGLDHLDSEHAAFLRRHFPKEVKEKVKANELERNREIFGPDYQPSKECVVM
ncbi:SPX domain-containing protein [Microdochium trichocladiopsis]|uniref:SPX domain-containing protein n=1 Tax=Microdochium trichocladiopsis TaxID=1682393 RepID=A0A9P9BM92_9PEZI|nr:SPX domain-containing protein [Microdochium trichocladiopsis]KAH7029363.1 SPX domain-containing protein [Microdochium trichocladiopsis]